MEGSIVFILIGCFTSFRICHITNFTREILDSCLPTIRLLFTPIRFIIQDECYVEEEEDEDELLSPEECESCNDRGGLTYDDIKLVMRSLAMVGWRSDEVGEGGGDDGKCKECRQLEGVHELLEEKKASLEELEEAFYVFDRNEDGFISPEELWGVLRRLGWEGMKLEDCERMIRVFDEDGDGRIDFSEFKNLMENAT
ncbi:probable calcium-binding protein CML46 [Elaeis guineensis]|uniref:Probable calcium-binding protein CML45 n=1 Tax=Elaeis guineensis var. tenera TaxID=51953 RepID=A0A6I9RS33_ELAGV|nr:probable calcium-binding protein CML45 [Elaeis guineensis]